MSSKSSVILSDSVKQKLIQEKCQEILSSLLKDDDNKYCADCEAKGPRWSAWNIGIFLCIRCAGIHRKLGVHISRVKSINLDSWQPEQIVSVQNMGNSKARQIYEANLPNNFRRPIMDTALEQFIRAKYEIKRYIKTDWSPSIEDTCAIRFDWDKEIREKIETKRKLKMMSAVGSSNNKIFIPTPPTSITTTKSNNTKMTTDLNSTSSNSNMLDLDIIGDTFDCNTFPIETVNDEILVPDKNSSIKTLVDEELDFFNQPVPDQNSRLQMTKDSIMALYNQDSKNQFVPSVNRTPDSFLNDIQRKLTLNRNGSNQLNLTANGSNNSKPEILFDNDFDHFHTYQRFN